MGGCLILGAIGRLLEAVSFPLKLALVFAAGLVILANSRPWEGLVMSTPLAAVFFFWVFRGGVLLPWILVLSKPIYHFPAILSLIMLAMFGGQKHRWLLLSVLITFLAGLFLQREVALHYCAPLMGMVIMIPIIALAEMAQRKSGDGKADWLAAVAFMALLFAVLTGRNLRRLEGARSMTAPQNERLFQYFSKRKVWLLEPDSDIPKLTQLR